MKCICRFGPRVRSLRPAPLILALALFGQVAGTAANILFVVNSFNDPAAPSNANDQEVFDRLTSQGHKITLADDNVVSVADTAGMDLILISSSSNSGAPGINPLSVNTLRTGRIPVICYEPGLYDELLFQRENTFGNAGGHTSLAISDANKGHPLAAGKSGTIEIVDAGNSATVSSSALPFTVGTNAIIIATNATPDIDVGHISIWAYEKGSRLADNATVVPSRRVAFYYNASTAPGAYNNNATALFDAAVKWTLEPPPNLPITVVVRSPASQNAAPDSSILVELEDGSSAQVNGNSISVTLNGAKITPTITKTGKITTAAATLPGFLAAGSVNKLSVVYSDTSTPPNTTTSDYSFTVENYATLPPGMKLAASAVDRAKAGFTIKLRQLEGTRPGGNNLTTVRAQLSDALIDPASNQPFADLIDRSQSGFDPGSGFKPDGTFTEVGVINYNQDANGVGNEAGVFVAPNFADKPIPGIPGTSGSTDQIALQARTVLDLKAGVYRFAVNSDDGFGVTAGSNPADAFALQAGAFNADRGQGTTEFSVAVAEDGLYPMELIFWETGGGAEVEFFSIDRTTGERILINNVANAKAIKAFQPPPGGANLPTVTSVKPKPGAVSVPKSSSIDITIADGASVVAASSIKLTLDGAAVTPAVTKAGAVTTISFKPASALAALSTHTVGLQFSDNATPPNARSETYTFAVESILPKALFLHTGTPTASDNLIAARLQSMGFEVVRVVDTASQTSDADGKDLIVISSSVGSGNIGTKYTASAVPIILWETALYDELGIEAGNVNGAAIAGQTQIEIVDRTHPLAAGLPAGPVNVLVNAGNISSMTSIVPGAKVVAQVADGSGQPAIAAIEKGASLNPDRIATAPARRVMFFLDNDSFINTTDDGKKLFDAAVKWAANLGDAPPKFNPLARQGNNLTLSWTGAGKLQQADSAAGPWTDAASQTNPQTITIAAGAKFYRLRQ